MFTSTTGAPRWASPKYSSTYATLLGIIRATGSPARTSSACSAAAFRSAAAATVPNVAAAGSPAKWRKGRSGTADALVRKSSPTTMSVGATSSITTANII